MPAYTPFEISDFKTGYFTGLEPWKAPADAFPTLLDARVEKGVLEKRHGYKELADTGAGYPIMGIAGTVQDGHPHYLVCDTKRVYLFRPYAETLTDLVESDVFSGTNRDYFWFDTWADKCFFSNGKQLYYYDAAADTTAALSTEGDVAIAGAKMIFHYHGRLIFVMPNVSPKWYPRRMYYTNVNTTTVDSSNYVNGDFADMPMTGCYIGNEPYIFCREGTVLRIRYTQNSDTPFTFETVTSDYPVLGPFPAPTFQDGAWIVGGSRVMRFDRYEMKILDHAVRDIVDEIELTKSWWLSAAVRKDKNLLYMTYTNADSSTPDRIVEYSYDEGNFAIARIAASVLHGTTGHIVPSWEDLETVLGGTAAMEASSEKDVIHHPDYGAMMLMGGLTGKVHLLDYGDDDDGSDIDMEVWTAAFNPFAKQGRKVKFGKLRMLVDSDSTASFTVGFYKDLSSTAYKTTTADCTGSGDQHWITLHPDGEVGNFHRISFTNSASDNRPRIHAMILEMAPAGKLDTGGAETEIEGDATTAGTSLWRWVQNDDGDLELQRKISGTWTKRSLWD